MPSVIEVSPKKGVPDIKGERVKTYITDYIKIPVDSVRTKTLYFFSDELVSEDAEKFIRDLLADSVVEEGKFLGNSPVYEQPEIPEDYRGSWRVRVGYKRKPLIMDNWGDETRLTLENIYKTKLGQVRKIDEYDLLGNLTKEQIDRICKEEKLADSKVQTAICIPMGEGND